MNQINPVKDQDRAFDLWDTFNKYGYCMFPQQRKIYQHLNGICAGRRVLEAGCGNGLGSAMLERNCNHLVATDKLASNVSFAKELYPWINFQVWDAETPYSDPYRPDVVVCVEMLEHTSDGRKVLNNLIKATAMEVWITTPNGLGKPKPPENPYHVREYTPMEVVEMAGPDVKVEVLSWDKFQFSLVSDPIVYRIIKGLS